MYIHGKSLLSYTIRAEDKILVECLLDHGANPHLAVEWCGQARKLTHDTICELV
jgi:hypothetical protein